jgi:acid phosphatase family membrane protein YuiD
MSRTIFFVDDDRDFLDAQAAFFRSRGFVVLTADHGDRARELLQEALPNIIVLDLMMERADTGVTLSHAIRQMDHLRSVPVILLTAVTVQVVCQVFKCVVYSIRDRSVTLSYLMTAGGIPSAHTAFVTALCTSIAIRNGVDSELFSVSAVFSAIVIYDAWRLRGHVQHHASLLNRHVLVPAGEPPVSEMIGHSVTEIAAGLVFGGVVAAAITLLVG